MPAVSGAPIPEVGEPRRTADLLVDILQQHGVEMVFGLPGGTISPVHDALLNRPIRVLTARHESGAMFAAAGYARASGKLAVVLVTSGPGVLNALTGLASAYCDGLPVLVLAGEVPRKDFGRLALQEGSSQHLSIVAMARSITKMAVELPSAEAAPALLQRAIHTALSGRRGPVLVTVPLDVSSKPIRGVEVASAVEVGFGVQNRAMDDAVRRAAASLWHAERPLIFAGSGVRWGDGPRRLRELAERLQAPVATTPKAKGVFPESHPLSLGVFGHGGHPSASSFLAQGIDVLLVVGSSLGDPATDGWSDLLRPKKHFIQIDADAMHIGRNYQVNLALIGPADGLLSSMLEVLPAKARPARQFGIVRFPEAPSSTNGLSPARALRELQVSMPAGTLYACDIGEHLLFATHYLHVDEPQGFLAMTGLGSMGSSVSGAIGMKLARPDWPVAAVCGDGCFMMLGMTDVAMAARDGIPVLVAVLNDGRFGMVENGHEAVYGRRPSYRTGDLDVAALARGGGAQAVVIRAPGDLLRLNLREMLKNGPVVLDVHIDRDARMPRNRRNDSIVQAKHFQASN